MNIWNSLCLLLVCFLFTALVEALPKGKKDNKGNKGNNGNAGNKRGKGNKHKAPLDFTFVKDSTIRKAQQSADGLPNDVNIEFDVMGQAVALNLKRNQKVQRAHDVFVIRKSKDGIPVLVKEQLRTQEVVGEYQDVKNAAIFTIRCPKENMTAAGNSCDATIEGTFRSGKEKFRMQLLDHSMAHMVRKRSAVDLWKRAKTLISSVNAMSRVYGIFKAEESPTSPSDYTEASPLVSGRTAEAFGHETKIVRENIIPGGQTHNIEILAIVDYAIYERFYKASKMGTEDEKDNEAKLNIKRYFSHVFNGVDMLYQNIDDPDFGISVAVVGFIIADSPEISPWTTPHTEGGLDRDRLLVQTPLNELISWTFSARNIPENDHIMLLTNYDLYSVDGGVPDNRTAGYARVGSICSLDSVSVVEDHGGFQSINAAAHELGHCLGARHDGANNLCNGVDQFIMTASGGFETEQTKTNPWKFSTCSVNYFRNTLANLPSMSCLSDPVEIFDEHQFVEFVSNYPGQYMGPNEQCQDILGLESFYGWGPELGMFNDICNEMSCSIPGSGRSYKVFKAATGTSCGDKRWCIEGQCVFDQQAPTKNPSCPFGDTQRLFGDRQSCRQYMMENPMRCYDDFYATRCCDTCEKLNTGVSGCEFGDKALGCSPRGCFDPSYAETCCSSCGLAPFPVLRNVTTLTPAPPNVVTPRLTQPPTVTSRPTFATWPTSNPTVTSRPTATFRPTATSRPTAASRPTVTSIPTVTSRPTFTPRPTFTTWPTSRPSETSRPPISILPTSRPTSRPELTPRSTGATVVTESTSGGDSSLIPSGSSGQCLRRDNRFLLVFRCQSLLTLFGANACDNSLVSRYCCEQCPSPGEEVCVDDPTCSIEYARECYIPSNTQKCCKTCKRYETNVPDCEFGDRIRSCSRYMAQLGDDLVCGQYRKYCCGSCSSLQLNGTGRVANNVRTNTHQDSSAIDPMDNPFSGIVITNAPDNMPTRVVPTQDPNSNVIGTILVPLPGGGASSVGMMPGRGLGRAHGRHFHFGGNPLTSRRPHTTVVISRVPSGRGRGRGRGRGHGPGGGRGTWRGF